MIEMIKSLFETPPDVNLAIAEWAIVAVVTVIGSTLASIMAKEPKIPKQRVTAREKFYEERVQVGKALAKRRKLVADTAASMTGRPASDFYGGKKYQEKMNALYDETLAYGIGAAQDIKYPSPSPEISSFVKDLRQQPVYSETEEKLDPTSREAGMKQEAQSLGLSDEDYLKLREKDKSKSYIQLITEFQKSEKNKAYADIYTRQQKPLVINPSTQSKKSKESGITNIYIGEYGGGR